MAKNLEIKLKKIESLTGFKADMTLDIQGYQVGLFQLEVNEYILVEQINTKQLDRIEATEEVIKILESR